MAGARLAREAARLPPGTVLLAGGETVVRLPARHGRGGRNLELALGAAQRLDEGADSTCSPRAPTAATAAPTPPAPSPTAAPLARRGAGALDPGGRSRATTRDSFFAALGDLFVTGPTGTNVGDWVFALRLE